MSKQKAEEKVENEPTPAQAVQADKEQTCTRLHSYGNGILARIGILAKQELDLEAQLTAVREEKAELAGQLSGIEDAINIVNPPKPAQPPTLGKKL